MASATLTSKGQVTIPVDVRNQLGLVAGDRIEFILNDKTGRYEVVPATRSVTALKGIIRKPVKPVSIEDMNAAIAAQGSNGSMIGLDTNVLVRYFAQDDPVQSRKASTLIESLTAERPGYVTQVALVEVVWVLGRAYDAGREEIAQVVETLLRTKEMVVEAAETVWRAQRLYAGSSADFADCLIERACHDAQCEYTATFDAKAAKTAGLKLIK